MPCSSSADRRSELEDTEDQLFRFARFVESNPDLRNVLADRSIDRSRRQELVGELLRGRATDATIMLAKRAVAARERTFANTIEGYVTLAAAQKNRVVATVRVAKPLTSDQRDRLHAALTKQIGRDVAIQEVIDPDILGGVRVELGDEVFEGTVVGSARGGPTAFWIARLVESTIEHIHLRDKAESADDGRTYDSSRGNPRST